MAFKILIGRIQSIKLLANFRNNHIQNSGKITCDKNGQISVKYFESSLTEKTICSDNKMCLRTCIIYLPSSKYG